ncbi:NADase-type glycan-binding domain-containing protein [Phytohabitans suffuscus]
MPSRPAPEPDDIDEIAPVLPQRIRVPRPTDTPKRASRRAQPGDLICGECGDPNVPTRKFCHRCGDSLVSAEVVRAPWWRRLLPRRRPNTVQSGLRPGEQPVGAPARRSFGERLVRTARVVIGVVLIALGTLYAAHAPFKAWVDGQATGVRTWATGLVVQDYAPVNPSSAAPGPGTPAIPANLAGAAIDGFTNTYWSTPVTEKRAPILLVTFSEPVRIDRALVRNGAADEFRTYHRAKDVHLVYSDGQTFDLVLKDTPDPQEVTIEHAVAVTTVEIHILSVYQSVEGDQLALSEIEFFAEQ